MKRFPVWVHRDVLFIFENFLSWIGFCIKKYFRVALLFDIKNHPIQEATCKWDVPEQNFIELLRMSGLSLHCLVVLPQLEFVRSIDSSTCIFEQAYYSTGEGLACINLNQVRIRTKYPLCAAPIQIAAPMCYTYFYYYTLIELDGFICNVLVKYCLFLQLRHTDSLF